MGEETVIVWDLETVPDLDAVGRVFGMVGAPASELRAVLGEGFPKHPFHKVACIGALIASRYPEGWAIEADWERRQPKLPNIERFTAIAIGPFFLLRPLRR